jgi:capsular exopolysaccharide synthesis family protein
MTENLPTRPDEGSRAVGPRADHGRAMSPDGEGGGGLDYRRLAWTFWRFKWFVLAILVAAGAAAMYLYRTMDPEYEAVATIWIQQNDHRDGPIRSQELLQSYAWVDLISSNTVLEPVVNSLRLYVKPATAEASGALRDLQPGQDFQPGRYTVSMSSGNVELRGSDDELIERVDPGSPVGVSRGFQWTPTPAELERMGPVEFSLVPPRAAAAELRNGLRVEMPPHGRFVRIRYRGAEPHRLATTVNEVADQLVTVAAELKSTQMDELAILLKEQLDYAEDNLRTSEVELENFRVNTITLPTDAASPVVPGVESTRGPAFSNFFQLNVEKEELRRDRQALRRAVAGADQDPSNVVNALEVIPSVQQSSELRTAMSQLTQTRAELRALRQRYTSEYEPVRQLESQVAEMERQVIPELAAGLAGEMSAREREIDTMLSSASDQLRSIPPRSTEEARLERRVNINQNLYVDLQRRYENARLAAVSSVPDVQVLDAAAPPQSPVDDQRPQLLMALLAGALGASVGLVFVLDRADRRVRYPDQVTHELGLPILGAVPNVGDNEAAGDAAVEAFREIRHGISEAYGTAGPVTVAITSPEKGDGKSFVTANLALSFASLHNRRVLVIDGDTRRGSLHRLFGVDRKPGLTDLLSSDDHALESVLHEVQDGLITFLPSGTRMTGGPELLTSARCARLMAELRTRYDVILMDTPPLAAGIDAFVLGRAMGHVALVIRSGQTHKELAAAKLDMLDRVPLRLLGAILNAVPNHRIYGYYSYSYGYLPSYGAGEESKPAPQLTKA